MGHRTNWVLAESNSNVESHFIWKYSTKGIAYGKLAEVGNMTSIDKFRIVNLFEGHCEISNKRKMFLNLKEYCDVLI